MQSMHAIQEKEEYEDITMSSEESDEDDKQSSKEEGYFHHIVQQSIDDHDDQREQIIKNYEIEVERKWKQPDKLMRN